MKLAPPQPERADDPASEASAVPAAAVRSFRSRESRSRASLLLRCLAVIFALGGALAVADGIATLVWQEPLSGLLAHFDQSRLAENLKRLERQAVSPADQRALAALPTDQQRMAYFARRVRQEARAGQAIGRIRIPRINASFVVVAGTDESSLKKGPGVYAGGAVPGLGGTVGIAGHRTTYLAPFRRINELAKGDRITLEMPYGLFSYTVLGHRIVSPDDVSVLRSAPYDQVVLTACNPLYSAAQRIVVFARLSAAAPAGAALAAPLTGALARLPAARPTVLPVIVGKPAPAARPPRAARAPIGSGTVVKGRAGGAVGHHGTQAPAAARHNGPPPRVSAPSLPSPPRRPQLQPQARRPSAVAPVHAAPRPPAPAATHPKPAAPKSTSAPPAAVLSPDTGPASAQTRVQGRPGGPQPIIATPSN